MSSSSVLKTMKDKEIEYVDLRFTDPRGKLQHLTMDATIVDEKMLNEGVFRWIKDKASAFMNKVKDIIKIFYENVIKKLILGIKKIAEKGISHLLESLDIEIVPSVSMKTPSW